ncbi:hypothetical protein [Sinorhizobium meliloti]|uniref:hypothetical protein n=1 Tax=Rhizobium meliloti TaxID=382 RepID=UPI0026ADC857
MKRDKRFDGRAGNDLKVGGKAATGRQRSLIVGALIVAGLLGAQAVALASMGHPWICTCGSVEFWYPDPSARGRTST